MSLLPVSLTRLLPNQNFEPGEMYEVFGDPDTGKTTLALSLIRDHQQTSSACLYIDADQSFPVSLAQQIEVLDDSLYLLSSKEAEEALSSALEIIKTGAVSLAVIDSISALSPAEELNQSMFSNTGFLQGNLLAIYLPLIKTAAFENKCTVLLLNQTRFHPDKYCSYGGHQTTSSQAYLSKYLKARIGLLPNVKYGKYRFRGYVSTADSLSSIPFDYAISPTGGVDLLSDLAFRLYKTGILTFKEGVFEIPEIKFKLAGELQALTQKLDSDPELRLKLEALYMH